jgi:hypothetical protein
MKPDEIAKRLTEAQREALIVPHLLVIDNLECVPDMDWPKELITYQWAQYDALSDLAYAVRKILQEQKP